MNGNGGAPPPLREAVEALVPMFQMTVAEVITTAGALLEIAGMNGHVVPTDTAERLDDSIRRLTKLRGDLEDVGAALRGQG